jgi:hypothetical protein
VAVVVSIARGHDASYPFKTIGAADGATITGQRGAGCYLSAVEKGGEPTGTWVATAPPNSASTTGTPCGGRTSSRCTASSSTPATRQARHTWAARRGSTPSWPRSTRPNWPPPRRNGR